MSDNEYKVSIKGEELTFEQAVPFELAKRLVAMAASGGKVDGRIKQTRTGEDGAGDSEEKDDGENHNDLALSEYISTHQATRIIEKITAIGEYLKLYRQKSTVTAEDLEAGFEEAGDPVPKNLARDLSWAKKSGWIAPKMGADGEYYVTTSGRAAINGNFGPEIKAKSKASGGGRRRKKAGARTS